EDQTTQRVVEQQELDAFVIADDTGQAVLHPPFTLDLLPYETGWQNLPPALYAILEREGISVKDAFGLTNNFYYAETVLMPGDEIMAVGRATIEVDPAGRAPAPREPPVMCHVK